MEQLALLGGEKVRTKPFPAYNTIGKEEEDAVVGVIRNGKLSRFLGAWHQDFFGGEQVRALEKNWAEKFGVKHAIAVNSATSALYCAVGAIGVGPGDEVIVSPYTMSASAAGVLVYNGIPVFADVEKDYYCLDYDSIEARITERTKAIIVVDIFGQPYDVERINRLAKEKGLYVIEDAAQAPGAMYKEKFSGTLGDIGIYSLNYHKHIHCGEGGIVVTDNDELADKIRLIRNHAEAVVEAKGTDALVNMIGFNYRMTEIEAAIANEQLKKLDDLVDKRLKNIAYLEKGLEDIPCLEMVKVRPHVKHTFYVYPMKFNEQVAGVPRDRFIEAVRAELPYFEQRESEGVKLGGGYVKPLYLQPLYQNLTGFGDLGCPFECPHYKGTLNYSKGICPNCEDLHYKELITHELMLPSMEKEDLDAVIEAFHKVWKLRLNLRED